MDSRMVGDFRVRCSVAQEKQQEFHVQIWTRRVGGSAPEKCWVVPGGPVYDNEEDARQAAGQVCQAISGVRFNGEPEFAYASA